MKWIKCIDKQPVFYDAVLLIWKFSNSSETYISQGYYTEDKLFDINCPCLNPYFQKKVEFLYWMPIESIPLPEDLDVIKIKP